MEVKGGKQALKVLHVGEYVKGGVATYIREVIDYQKKAKEITDIHLMLSNTNSDLDFALPKDKIIVYDYRRSIKFFIKALISIYKNIAVIKPDIIHVHSTFAGVFVRLPLLFARKKYKVIYCSHGWSFCMETSNFKKKVYEIIEKLLAVKTDKLINISAYEHRESINRGFSPEKVTLINNGISEEQRLGTLNLEIDQSKINLLFVGRFDKQKGLDILLDFFREYNNENIKLYIIGDSVLDGKNIEVPKNVTTIGWVDNNQIDSYYNLFDAVIIPSRWEGFGLVAIEAMKNKKAIIVSNRGALPDLTDSDNGYIFDIQKLETLKKILDSVSKEKLREKGHNGFELFNKKYTSSRMNKEIIESYKDALK